MQRVDVGRVGPVDDANRVHVEHVPVSDLAVGATCEQLALVRMVGDRLEEVGREERINAHKRVLVGKRPGDARAVGRRRDAL